MPIPIPPVGGIPYSSASQEILVHAMASGSPAAARTACAVNRSRCATGSTSSEYAVARSIPPM